MRLWASLYTLTKLNRTSIAFVFVLFLCQHTAIENLLTDATQQPLEFYDSRLSAQAAAVTPVVSPVVLLGESACRGSSTAPSPAACSNELLEIPYGLDAHTVEVDDAVSLHLYSEYV